MSVMALWEGWVMAGKVFFFNRKSEFYHVTGQLSRRRTRATPNAFGRAASGLVTCRTLGSPGPNTQSYKVWDSPLRSVWLGNVLLCVTLNQNVSTVYLHKDFQRRKPFPLDPQPTLKIDQNPHNFSSSTLPKACQQTCQCMSKGPTFIEKYKLSQRDPD